MVVSLHLVEENFSVIVFALGDEELTQEIEDFLADVSHLLLDVALVLFHLIYVVSVALVVFFFLNRAQNAPRRPSGSNYVFEGYRQDITLVSIQLLS